MTIGRNTCFSTHSKGKPFFLSLQGLVCYNSSAMQHLGGGEVWQRLKNDRAVPDPSHTRENAIKLSSICTVQRGGMEAQSLRK